MSKANGLDGKFLMISVAASARFDRLRITDFFYVEIGTKKPHYTNYDFYDVTLGSPAVSDK